MPLTDHHSHRLPIASTPGVETDQKCSAAATRVWEVECNKLACLPEDLGKLTSLKMLKVWQCPVLKLKSIVIENCPILAEGCAKDVGPEWHTISHIKYIEVHFTGRIGTTQRWSDHEKLDFVVVVESSVHKSGGVSVEIAFALAGCSHH
ncbi:hypothetical protein Dimus_037477 [Dionaea muscipula]